MQDFGRNMYYWRRLSPEDREEVLQLRHAQNRPWHSPPHNEGGGRFLLSATCYEHGHILGHSWQRMSEFENRLLAALESAASPVHGWVVLPNHYHAVVCVGDVAALLKKLARLHGRTSFEWNGEDGARGRKVWYSTVDSELKSDRHFHAAVNYVHHNPVKHGFAKKWIDWPFSSAAAYINEVGREAAIQYWREYDISSMGETWDP